MLEIYLYGRIGNKFKQIINAIYANLYICAKTSQKPLYIVVHSEFI